MANYVKTSPNSETLIETYKTFKVGQIFKLNDVEIYRCLKVEKKGKDTIFHVYRAWFIYGYENPPEK